MLEIKGLKKAFGSLEVLKGVDLFINHKVIFDYLFKSSYMPV